MIVAIKNKSKPKEAFNADEDVELMGVYMVVGTKKITLITGYGPRNR